jgi:hypothetical protein
VCDTSRLSDQDKEHPENLLNLVSKYNTGNCYALGVVDWIKNYTDIKDIFQAHGTQKLIVLEKRLLKKKSILQEKIDKKSILLRFIQLVLSGELLIFQKDKETVQKNMLAHNFLEKDFEYLLGTSFFKCTLEKIRELESEIKELLLEKDILDKKNVWDIWMEDLENLERAFHIFSKEIEDDEKSIEVDEKNPSKLVGKKRPRKN